MPDQPELPREQWMDPPVILLIIALLIAGGAVALTFWTTRWIGHAVTAFMGLALLATVIFTGAVQKGRIRHIAVPRLFRFHRMVSTGFGLFVIGTYLLGILTALKFGGQLVKFPHGVVGLVLVIMVVIQLVPSLLIGKRTRIQALHRFVGYAMIPVFILEIIIGLFRARIL